MDVGFLGHLPGPLQHFFRKVQPQDPSRPLPGGIPAMPPVAAAQIQHPLAGKVRQHLLQSVPFAGSFQPLF